MLEIKPIQSFEEQKEVLDKCGLTAREGAFAYKAFEGGSLVAAAQFDIKGSEGYICGMERVIGTEYDFEAMFILGRAVMNFLDLCGVSTAVYEVNDETSERYARMLGFRPDGERFSVVLTGMFTTPCSHKDCEGGGQ